MIKQALSRRNFFAAAAGAVAAPSLTTSIAMSGGGLNTASMVGGGLMVKDCMPQPPSLSDELKYALKERASTATHTAVLGAHQIDNVARFAIDSLRSVSPVAKARMAYEAEQRRYAEQNLRFWDQRIAELKQQLGPVGAMIIEAAA